MLSQPSLNAFPLCMSQRFQAPASHTIQGTPLAVSSGTKKEANLRTESHKSKLWVIKNGSMPKKLENNSQHHKLHLAFKKCFKFSYCCPKRSHQPSHSLALRPFMGKAKPCEADRFSGALNDGVAKFVQLFQVPKKKH